MLNDDVYRGLPHGAMLIASLCLTKNEFKE